MSESILQQLEQELEATQQRCHTIERAIAALREIYPVNGHKARRTNRGKVVRAAKEERTDGRTDGRTEQSARQRNGASLTRLSPVTT